MKLMRDILRRITEQNPQTALRLREAEALTHWERAVGAPIARHARAFKVERGVLYIEVDHPAWQTELHHRKRQILEQLNAQVPGGKDSPPITDLFFIRPR